MNKLSFALKPYKVLLPIHNIEAVFNVPGVTSFYSSPDVWSEHSLKLPALMTSFSEPHV